MGNPHDLINEIYNEEKYLSTVTTFSKISFFVTGSLIIRFKFLFHVFFEGPTSLGFRQRRPNTNGGVANRVGEERPPTFFKTGIRVSKFRVEYLGRKFLDPYLPTLPLPLKSVCVCGGGVVLVSLMI